MYKINPRYECKYCSCIKKTKEAFENHIYLCKYIHTDKAENEIIHSTTPSIPILINYIVELTKKYERLEAKVDQIQSSSHRKNNRVISDYLKTQTPTVPFQIWLEKCQIDVSYLEILFEKDSLETIDLFICQKMNLNMSLQTVPFRAFKNKKNLLYVYDRPTVDSQVFEWRIATHEDLQKIINMMGNRFLRLYLEWQKEQSAEDEQSEDKNANYMRKVNEFSKDVDKKIIRAKKKIIELIEI